MTTELVFESRSSVQILRQDGAIECEPVIALQLALMSGPNIYVSDGPMLNHARWTMQVARRSGAADSGAPGAGAMLYAREDQQAHCAIEVSKSPQRYAALLDMFRGGHVSEITIKVRGLVEKADYSKAWDTAAGASLTIESIRFEFPLPQSEA